MKKRDYMKNLLMDIIELDLESTEKLENLFPDMRIYNIYVVINFI